MKSERLFEVLGGIDPEFVEEAREMKKAPRLRWLRWGALAACLCLVWAGTLYRPEGDTIGGAPELSSQTTIVDLEKPQAAVEQQGEESVGPGAACEPGEVEIEEGPAQENPVGLGTVDVYEAVWGGCYTDATGKTYVLLTEDTPEIRNLIYERNPDITRENAVFLPADHTQAYLDELMEEISAAMAGGELPGVVSAARLDDRNCVEVTMTGPDEQVQARIRAMDTQGGAVEFVVGGQVVHDVAILVE